MKAHIWLAALVLASCSPGPGPALLPEPLPSAVPFFETAAVQKLTGQDQAWWLTDPQTGVQRAWNYSLGYNLAADRPVRVAVIDMGFAGAWQAMQPGGDLAGQILWQEGRRITVKPHLPRLDEPWTLASLQQENEEILLPGRDGQDAIVNLAKSHGTQAASIIASRLNDGSGITGVAPQARIIPFKAGNGFKVDWEEVTLALEHIARVRPVVDVVSISLWGSLPEEFTAGWNERHSGWPWYPHLQRLFRELEDQGTIVVAAAGNGSWDAGRNFPAGIADGQGQVLFPEVIAVGATAADGRRALFQPDFPHRKSHGSNWGDTVTIWAPGHNMAATGAGSGTVFDADTGRKSIERPGEVTAWAGTSAATPLVAGVAALLKAGRPELKGGDLARTLQQTAQSVNYLDPALRTPPFLSPSPVVSDCGKFNESMSCGSFFPGKISLRRLNALAAAQALLPSAALAQIFRGRWRAEGTLVTQAGVWQLGFGADRQLGDYLAADGEHPVRLRQLAEGSLVEVSGWPVGEARLNVLAVKVLETGG